MVKVCRAVGSSETNDQARAVWGRLEPELQRPPVSQGGGAARAPRAPPVLCDHHLNFRFGHSRERHRGIAQ